MTFSLYHGETIVVQVQRFCRMYLLAESYCELLLQNCIDQNPIAASDSSSSLKIGEEIDNEPVLPVNGHGTATHKTPIDSIDVVLVKSGHDTSAVKATLDLHKGEPIATQVHNFCESYDVLDDYCDILLKIAEERISV